MSGLQPTFHHYPPLMGLTYLWLLSGSNHRHTSYVLHEQCSHMLVMKPWKFTETSSNKEVVYLIRLDHFVWKQTCNLPLKHKRSSSITWDQRGHSGYQPQTLLEREHQNGSLQEGHTVTTSAPVQRACAEVIVAVATANYSILWAGK